MDAAHDAFQMRRYAEEKRRYLVGLQGAERAPSTSFRRAQRLGVRPVSGAFPRNTQFSADSSAVLLKARALDGSPNLPYARGG